jgi:hypothetical protein
VYIHGSTWNIIGRGNFVWLLSSPFNRHWLSCIKLLTWTWIGKNFCCVWLHLLSSMLLLSLGHACTAIAISTRPSVSQSLRNCKPKITCRRFFKEPSLNCEKIFCDGKSDFVTNVINPLTDPQISIIWTWNDKSCCMLITSMWINGNPWLVEQNLIR